MLATRLMLEVGVPTAFSEEVELRRGFTGGGGRFSEEDILRSDVRKERKGVRMVTTDLYVV